MADSLNRVAPKLWQGSKPEPGCYRNFPVIVLMAKEYQPFDRDFPCSQIIHAPIDDAFDVPLDDVIKIIQATNAVVKALNEGKRVLVTCNMGYNRSGVVTALALRKGFGLSADKAIKMVRAARGSVALSNPWFEKLVRHA